MAKTIVSRKTQITEIAQALFQEQGYAATSMRHLAAEVGIEPASLYNHFQSKEEILRDICFGMASEFNKNLDQLNDKSMLPSKWLAEAIKIHILFILANNSAAGVFFEEWRHLSQPYRLDFEWMRKQYEQRFIAVIKLGQRSNEFIDIQPQLFVLQLFGAMNHIHKWYNPDGKWSAKKIANQISEVFLNGIKNSAVVN
jgi:AcrR family transcriptional regulator